MVSFSFVAALVLSVGVALVYAGGPASCICLGHPSNCNAWTTSLCTVSNLESSWRITTVSGLMAACSNGVAGSATCAISSFSGNCPSQSDGSTACGNLCSSMGAGNQAAWSCTSSGGSSSSCFPANATAQLEDNSRKRMSDLAVGDKVLATTGVYSDVYMFSHKLSAVRAEFVQISTASGLTVTMTANHYLYVNERLAVASIVKVGDKLKTASGAADEVTSVSNVFANGLYNPHTMHGDIVVDGVQTSTYTSDIEPTLAHAALWPVRMLHSMGKNVAGDTFANGSDLIAAIMPDGKKQY